MLLCRPLFVQSSYTYRESILSRARERNVPDNHAKQTVNLQNEVIRERNFHYETSKQPLRESKGPSLQED